MRKKYYSYSKTSTLIMMSLCIFIGMNLSGCIASRLVEDKIQPYSEQITEQQDKIPGIGKAIQNDKSQSLVFIGEKNDYLIIQGSEDLQKILTELTPEQRILADKLPLTFIAHKNDDYKSYGLNFIYPQPQHLLYKENPKMYQKLIDLGFQPNKKSPNDEQYYLGKTVELIINIYPKHTNNKLTQSNNFAQGYPITLKKYIPQYSENKKVTKDILKPIALTIDLLPLLLLF